MTDAGNATRAVVVERLVLRYELTRPPVIDDLSASLPPRQITAIIGANGSGKSTLLKSLAGQLRPASGRVILDGRDASSLSPRDIAQQLGILFQEHAAPGDLTVESLVEFGRYAHRRPFEPTSNEDRAAVENALRVTRLEQERHRPIRQLSGGQRQLAWIAMAIAQEPQYLLLDEPTTFLDLAHQFDVMDVIRRLNREEGRTVVLVVHDLNLVARYADHVVALRSGRIVAAGTPREVLTPATIRTVFGVDARIVPDNSSFFCVPLGRSD